VWTSDSYRRIKKMAMLERRIQKDPKQDEYREWEKKWEAIEKRLGGFPAKRHYVLVSGSDDSGTIVWEREWDSFAASEVAYDKLFEDSEAQRLASTAASIYGGERIEFYTTW
jgi:hypothetical protein